MLESQPIPGTEMIRNFVPVEASVLMMEIKMLKKNTKEQPSGYVKFCDTHGIRCPESSLVDCALLDRSLDLRSAEQHDFGYR